MSAPTAALAQRADRYYQVVCFDEQGQRFEAESVDAHAVEQGGKGHAVELFSQNYPFRLTRSLEGPFTS